MVEGHVTEAEKENVLIRAGACSITLLPHFGGKISSILLNELELLQAPLAPLAPRTRTMAFDEGDASGWDECLPSVAACSVKTAIGLAEVPDHGDLWRVAWEPIHQNANSITCRGECFSLPLRLERTLALSEIEGGWRLSLNYTVKNVSAHPVPWSWSAHPLFAVDAGDEIRLPETIKTLRLEGSGGRRLGAAGSDVTWPVATLARGGSARLNVTEDIDSCIGDKLFAGPLGDTENWCTLMRHRVGVSIRFKFDEIATPYLGLWLCYGGWPDRLGLKQMCVAVEPATAPVDSLAQTGPWSRELAAGESASWPLDVYIEMI